MYNITPEGIFHPPTHYFMFFSKEIISIFARNDETGNRGTSTRFKHLSGVTINQQTRNLFVIDEYDHNIRKITP
jgi:hypothetical protein